MNVLSPSEAVAKADRLRRDITLKQAKITRLRWGVRQAKESLQRLEEVCKRHGIALVVQKGGEKANGQAKDEETHR